jgi:hypothetical protein
MIRFQSPVGFGKRCRRGAGLNGTDFPKAAASCRTVFFAGFLQKPVGFAGAFQVNRVLEPARFSLYLREGFSGTSRVSE